MTKNFFKNAGNALKIQKDQINRANQTTGQIENYLGSLNEMQKRDSAELDDLINQAEFLCAKNNIDVEYAMSKDIDFSEIDSILEEIDVEKPNVNIPVIEKIDTVDIGDDWDSYLDNIDVYAEKHNIDFSNDPFQDLLSPDEKREILQRIEDDYKLHGKVECDKWDYIFAAASGVIAGLIDSFFVGMPGQSKLGNWTNTQADKLVDKFANIVYKSDRRQIEKLIHDGKIKKPTDFAPNGMRVPKKEPDGIASSIGYLEKRFNVPYDARYAKDLIGAEGKVVFNPSDHHLKSLGHSPDLVGLFFSVLDQFTGNVSIIADGKIQRFEPSSTSFRLQGKNFYEKLLFGFINWFGHLISDMAGSSGTRGHVGKTGAGISAPFFEFFQLCNFGSINVGEDTKTLAQFTTRMYENGYDARFVAAQAIPVALNEVVIRLLWSIKRHYYHKKVWKECIPLKLSNKPELRRMLLVGHGCLCLVDVADAAIRSGGCTNVMEFALRINYVAWFKFAKMGLQEIKTLYKKDALNVEEMENDLKSEWEILLLQTNIA